MPTRPIRSDVTSTRVTVVMVPRERFSESKRSLEALYSHTRQPFELIYVDGGSPPALARWLRTQSAARDFTLIRSDRHLSPNDARNRGLAKASTEFVVFIDNDVSVSPGWLDALLDCADATGAAVVGPLTCIGEPLGETIHFAGGEVVLTEDGGDRGVKERMFHPNRKVAKVSDQLKRSQCTLAEFHCVMARRDLFDRIGPFDEEMLNTREHLDFCLAVAEAGGEVWFEPRSVVTYVPGPPFRVTDLAFYMLRWSDDWERRSLARFRDKWQLDESEFFEHRLSRLGWRRDTSLLRPLARRLAPSGRGARNIERAMRLPERRLNWLLAERHRRLASRDGI